MSTARVRPQGVIPASDTCPYLHTLKSSFLYCGQISRNACILALVQLPRNRRLTWSSPSRRNFHPLEDDSFFFKDDRSNLLETTVGQELEWAFAPSRLLWDGVMHACTRSPPHKNGLELSQEVVNVQEKCCYPPPINDEALFLTLGFLDRMTSCLTCPRVRTRWTLHERASVRPVGGGNDSDTKKNFLGKCGKI